MKASKRGCSKEYWVLVLSVRNRSKHTFETILHNISEETLAHELKGKQQNDGVLCSDRLKSYVAISLRNNLIHKRLNTSSGIKVIDKVFSSQNVNAFHSRLKGWMKRFHGVVTKYLDHSLGWRQCMDATEELNEKRMLSLQCS